MTKKLKLALPKGSLEEATYALMRKAGFNTSVSNRSYFPSVDDPELEVVLYRPQEMSRYVEDGVVDCGITGHDWVVENSSKVLELCELSYSKRTRNPVRWRSLSQGPLTRPCNFWTAWKHCTRTTGRSEESRGRSRARIFETSTVD